MAGPHVIRYAVADPAELRHVSFWTEMDVTLKENVPFAFSAQELDVDDVILQIGRVSPCNVNGRTPAAMASMFIPLDGGEFACAFGVKMGPCGIFMLGGGARFELACDQDLGWALVSISDARVGSLLMRPRTSALFRPSTVAYCRAGQAAWTRMVSLLRDAQRVLDRTPAIFEVQAARRGLRAELLDAACAVLAARGRRRTYIRR